MSDAVRITMIICLTILGLGFIGKLGGKKWNINLLKKIRIHQF
jgi:hypothetical protein